MNHAILPPLSAADLDFKAALDHNPPATSAEMIRQRIAKLEATKETNRSRERIADYKAPDRLVLVESLPVTSMLKVDKRALAARMDEEP